MLVFLNVCIFGDCSILLKFTNLQYQLDKSDVISKYVIFFFLILTKNIFSLLKCCFIIFVVAESIDIWKRYSTGANCLQKHIEHAENIRFTLEREDKQPNINLLKMTFAYRSIFLFNFTLYLFQINLQMQLERS